MLSAVKLIGLYVVCLAAVAGSFVLVAVGKATWGEVGPLVSAIVLGLAGIHASAITSSGTVSTSPASPASASGGSGPVGVGAAGTQG